MGSIEIEGATTLPVERVREFLTRRKPAQVKLEYQFPAPQRPKLTVYVNKPKEQPGDDDNDDPLWDVGRPASFSGNYKSKLESSLKKCFEQLGYFDTSFVTNAEKVAVTRQTIIALEAGKYTPSLLLAFRLATALGVRIEDVFQYACGSTS